jgi:acyl-CoA synthetase
MLLTLHNPQTARDYYLQGIWQNETLYTLLRQHARNRPTAAALRDPYRRMVWGEVLESVDLVAETLQRAGLCEGDRVAVWLPNRIESVIIMLACSRNGYVCCPSLHHSYTSEEIVTLLRRIRCKAFFGLPGHGADGKQVSIFDRLGQVESLLAAYALGPEGRTAPKEGIAGARPYPNGVTGPAVKSSPVLNPDKIVYLAFTSGTTGLPKGVMHSDNSLLANGRMLVRDWGHTENSILLTLSPISHHIGTVAIEQMLVAGMELAIYNAAVGASPVDAILETGATYVMGVPTHAMDVLDEMRRRGIDSLGRVRVFYMAGSPIPREVAERFMRIGVTPQNVYGMTENGSHQYTLPNDTGDVIVSTCGRACYGYEVHIFDAENADVEITEPGRVGEIGGRGGLLMLGYYDDQIATETSFNKSGWFMSGDLGVLDDQGCLTIAGRKKDLIIRGGHNIHPARIEDLAHRHDGVAKAAAFGVPDERLGEKVCLAVIARPGAKIDSASMLQHLYEAGLSRYDMPEYFLIMEAFPLTASGKILKRELQAWVKAGRIQPEAVRWSDPGKESKRAAGGRS